MTPNPEQSERLLALAGELTRAQQEALDYEERTHLESCQLNALGLVHTDVVKDRDGTLIDLRTRLTPLGVALRDHLRARAGDGA